MAHVPPAEWFVDRFQHLTGDCDLIRLPRGDYETLSDKEKDGLRQTQSFGHETVQVLALAQGHALVRKYDQTLGWVPERSLGGASSADLWIPPFPEPVAPLVFLERWLTTPYVWGGIAESGIDCSGFTQRYFSDVLNLRLPKNSLDQRKLGTHISLSEIQNHDLVFCFSHEANATHHVGVHFDGAVWHARRKGGIVRQPQDDFEREFRIEVVKRFSLSPR